MLLAFGRFCHHHPPLLDALLPAVTALEPRYHLHPQHVFNTLLSLANLDAIHPKTHVFNTFHQILQRINSRDLPMEQQTQAFQIELILNLNQWEKGPQSERFSMQYNVARALVPPGIMYKGMKNWVRSAASPTKSATQAKIFRLLTEGMKLQGVTMEKVTPDQLFSVDIAVTGPRGRDIAVEVNGSDHYSVNTPYVSMSNTVLRRRVLKGMGWLVVEVPPWEWAVACGTGDLTRYL